MKSNGTGVRVAGILTTIRWKITGERQELGAERPKENPGLDSERDKDYMRGIRHSADERRGKTMATVQELVRVAQEADDAWSALLQKQFGKAAGDVRYTPRGKGEPGSDLRVAHDRFLATSKAWQDAWNAQRQAAKVEG